jgi:hypothetical protein
MPDQQDANIPVILGSTMGTDQWDLQLPPNVPVQAIIQKLIASPELPFREQDDGGRRVPYRLMYQEGDRMLREAETLSMAGVQPSEHLIMTHQARAGRTRRAWSPAR